MAESMQGLKRSHRCAEVSNALEGQKVTVMGWVQKSRNKVELYLSISETEAVFFRSYLRNPNAEASALRRQQSLRASM